MHELKFGRQQRTVLSIRQRDDMVKVFELMPGDRVTHGDMSAIFVTSSPHPLFDGFTLVIWRLDDKSWMSDALLPVQEVGERVSGDRIENLRQALLGRT